MTYKDFLKEKYDAVNEIVQEKKRHIEQIHKVRDQMAQLENERQKLRKNLHRDY